MHLPAAQVVRDVVRFRAAVSIRGIHAAAAAAVAAAAAAAASDMQRQRRALIGDRQLRLGHATPRATLARIASGIT